MREIVQKNLTTLESLSLSFPLHGAGLIRYSYYSHLIRSGNGWEISPELAHFLANIQRATQEIGDSQVGIFLQRTVSISDCFAIISGNCEREG